MNGGVRIGWIGGISNEIIQAEREGGAVWCVVFSESDWGATDKATKEELRAFFDHPIYVSPDVPEGRSKVVTTEKFTKFQQAVLRSILDSPNKSLSLWQIAANAFPNKFDNAPSRGGLITAISRAAYTMLMLGWFRTREGKSCLFLRREFREKSESND